jgi:hypothetical protein
VYAHGKGGNPAAGQNPAQEKKQVVSGFRLGKAEKGEGDQGQTQAGQPQENKEQFPAPEAIYHGPEGNAQQGEPVRAGLAPSRPMRTWLRAMDSASFGTTGPKAETPAKPAKKATAVQRSAALGLDLAWQTVSMGPFPEL